MNSTKKRSEGPSLQIVKCEETAWVVFKDKKKLKQSGSFSTVGFKWYLIIGFLNVKAEPYFLICKYLFYPYGIINVKVKNIYIFDKLMCCKIVNVIINDENGLC